MRAKIRFHLLGWITLIIFPAPALWALWYFEDSSPLTVLALDELTTPLPIIGLLVGVLYAFLIIAFGQFSFLEDISNQQERFLKSLNLNWGDALFMSFCAGFGEELLFRAGMQHWLGIAITSLVFIALHGYFNPKSWRKSIYGLVILPFILLLGFGYNHFGLWFCIAAHFAYDFVLFSQIVGGKRDGD